MRLLVCFALAIFVVGAILTSVIYFNREIPVVKEEPVKVEKITRKNTYQVKKVKKVITPVEESESNESKVPAYANGMEFVRKLPKKKG